MCQRHEKAKASSLSEHDLWGHGYCFSCHHVTPLTYWCNFWCAATNGKQFLSQRALLPVLESVLLINKPLRFIPVGILFQVLLRSNMLHVLLLFRAVCFLFLVSLQASLHLHYSLFIHISSSWKGSLVSTGASFNQSSRSLYHHKNKFQFLLWHWYLREPFLYIRPGTYF